MEREVGGGIGMGKTCKLKDVSFQCMTKFTTKKNKKKKKKIVHSINNCVFVFQVYMIYMNANLFYNH